VPVSHLDDFVNYGPDKKKLRGKKVLFELNKSSRGNCLCGEIQRARIKLELHGD